MNERGSSFHVQLGNAMSEGVHSEEFGWRARESVKQDYKRDSLVGWTTSEEGHESTW